MKIKDMQYLFWVDLETTGLHPTFHSIIEFAVVITDRSLCIMDKAHGIVKPHLWPMLTIDNECIAMHQKSGLLDQLESGGPIDFYETHLRDLCLKYTKDYPLIMAGSGVAHFDRKFIERHLPLLTPFFAIRCLDVSVIRTALEFNDKAYTPMRYHRAEDDIIETISEFRIYLKMFNTILSPERACNVKESESDRTNRLT